MLATSISNYQLGKYKEATDKCEALIKNLPKKYCTGAWPLLTLLYLIGDEKQKYHESNEKYHKGNFLQLMEEGLAVNIFPTQGRLCSMFPFVEFTTEYGMVRIKPSFSFPFIKPPNMIPTLDTNVLAEFKYKEVPCRPEAPWIKRCKYGIKFTDEIEEADKRIISAPKEKKEKKSFFFNREMYSKVKRISSSFHLKAYSDTQLNKKEDHPDIYIDDNKR